MEKQTVYSIYKAVTDNRKASEDNNDEVTEEPKLKMKKKKKSTRKKISKLTREEEVESKLCCYLVHNFPFAYVWRWSDSPKLGIVN